VPYVETWASDPKKATLTFRKDLHQAGQGQLPCHHYADIMCAACPDGLCVMHQRACRASTLRPGPDHLAVFGWPCQPFSRQRAGRYKKPVASHPKEHVQQLVVNSLLHHKPYTFVGENVLGLDDPDEGNADSPSTSFEKSVGGVYWTKTVRLELQTWVHAERPRPGTELQGDGGRTTGQYGLTGGCRGGDRRTDQVGRGHQRVGRGHR